jgi:hypothetical protein
MMLLAECGFNMNPFDTLRAEAAEILEQPIFGLSKA